MLNIQFIKDNKLPSLTYCLWTCIFGGLFALSETQGGKKFCFNIFFLDGIIMTIILIDGPFLQSAYCVIIYLVNCSFLDTV